MSDLKGQQLQNSYQDLVTDSGSNLSGIENGHGADITARIVERDSNSDGEWVRYADGTQIIYKEVEEDSVSITIESGSIFRSGNISIGSPARNFISKPKVVIFQWKRQRVWSSPGTATPSTTSLGNLSVLSAGSATRDLSFDIIGIGRWK